MLILKMIHHRINQHLDVILLMMLQYVKIKRIIIMIHQLIDHQN